MRLLTPLHSLWLLGVVALLGGALALFEHHQTRLHQHLQDRLHPQGQPRLKGESLQELAQVLLELYPEGAEAHLLMGTALAEQGRLAQARPYLEKALQIDRRNQNLLFIYARLLLDMGEDPEQIKGIVDEIRRYFPRSREKMEEYFEQASKGKIRFEEEAVY